MPEFKGDVVLQGVTIINVPGAKQTTVTGINNNGQVVGHFTDTKDNRHGFLYKEGAYSQPLDCPNAEETYVLGVNSYCQIVGRCKNGFLYSKGRFSPQLSYPGSALTTPNDINDYGEIAGTYQDATGKTYGFLYSAGEIYPITGPDGEESFAEGINDGGQIAGGFSDSFGTSGFVYLENAGVYSATLQYPGAQVTYPHGITPIESEFL